MKTKIIPRLDQLTVLLGDAESALSGLLSLLSNMPDGQIDALEPSQLMALVTPSVERIHLALELLPLLDARHQQPPEVPAGILLSIPPRPPHE